MTFSLTQICSDFFFGFIFFFLYIFFGVHVTIQDDLCCLSTRKFCPEVEPKLCSREYNILKFSGWFIEYMSGS
jgi:hypothetical protein